eukprot:m.137866 g.137866  ORF g.137866 m.137866 type:complete len:59 (+) comp24009_c0_seq1:894-1070(+)
MGITQNQLTELMLRLDTAPQRTLHGVAWRSFTLMKEHDLVGTLFDAGFLLPFDDGAFA